MVQLKIIVQILPHKKNEFIQAVKDLCDHELNKQDKIHLGIYQDLSDENIFCYLEEWDSREKLDAHIQTERFEMLIGAMKVLGEIQIVQIYEIEKTETLSF